MSCHWLRTHSAKNACINMYRLLNRGTDSSTPYITVNRGSEGQLDNLINYPVMSCGDGRDANRIVRVLKISISLLIPHTKYLLILTPILINLG